MGMFGSIGKAVGGYFDGPIPWADRLSAAGAALGGDAATSAAIRSHAVTLLKAQQDKAQQDAVFKQIADMMQPTYQDGPAPAVSRPPGLIGGQAARAPVGEVAMPQPAPEPAPSPPAYQYQAPQRTSNGLTIDDPRMAAVALAASRAKIPLATMIEVLKAQQPHMMSAQDGTLINDKSSRFEGMQFPKLDNGIVSQRDPSGNLTGATDLPGYARAAARIAGATQDAQERAKSRYVGPNALATERARAGLDIVPLNNDDGSTTQATRLDAASILSGGGAGGGAPRGTAFGPRVGVSQSPADAAYASGNAKAASDAYQTLQTAAQKAPAEIAKYTRLGELLKGYEGGKYSPALKDLTSAANSLGFSIDKNLPNKDAAAAITNQLALSLRDPSSGGGMPGAMSDADRNFLVQSVPGLVQTAAGRKSMVEAQVKVLQRNQDVGAKARQWQDRFGRLDKPDATGKHFQDYLDAWAVAHPLFAHQ